MKFKHTGITVSDMEGALAFWRDEMGLECTFRSERNQEQWLTDLVDADPYYTLRIAYVGPLELIEYIHPVDPEVELDEIWGRSPHVSHVCFEVEDITPWLKKLANRIIGFAIIPDGPNEGAEVGYFKAFDDYVLELFQP
jgi:catechol 2,3-dioxygenase-like lactoylglutathione lyase family enzyme